MSGIKSLRNPFKRPKDNHTSNKKKQKNGQRNISTKILQINLDELKRRLDEEQKYLNQLLSKQQKLQSTLTNKNTNKAPTKPLSSNSSSTLNPITFDGNTNNNTKVLNTVSATTEPVPKKNMTSELKFCVELEYNNCKRTIDRSLKEFIHLRSNLQQTTNNQLPPFQLFPYGSQHQKFAHPSYSSTPTFAGHKKNKSSKFGISALGGGSTSSSNQRNGDGNNEAPFLREMRIALDRWLETVVHHQQLQLTTEVTTFLEIQEIENELRNGNSSSNKSQHNKYHIKKICVVDDFVLLKVLGKGSFGKVLLVRKKDDHQIYAMKCLKKQRVFQRHQVEHTKSERRVLGYLNHPFLIALHYAFQTDQKLFLVLDYCAGGELFFHLSKAGRFTEDRTRFYVSEIVLAIEYLHEKHIIYRDLKPENILLDFEGHVKICDFGLCKENVPDNVTAHSFCGTPEYLAPEILRKVGHGKAADWWTMGALIYEMLCGVPPFYSRSRDALFDKILRQKIRFPNYFSRNSIDIIKQLMQRNPKYRLGSRTGAKEIQNHVFFLGVNWEAIFRREVEPPFRPRMSKDKHGVRGAGNFDPEFTGMPINSLDTNKRKYAPFEDFTFDGYRAEEDILQNRASFDTFNKVGGGGGRSSNSSHHKHRQKNGSKK